MTLTPGRTSPSGSPSASSPSADSAASLASGMSSPSADSAIAPIAANTAESTAESPRYDRSLWASAFRNVESELTDVPLQATRGTIPADLRGTLYRNGPGRLERSGQWVHHPFDGDGMITALRFESGGAALTNRFIRTEGWLAEEQAGRYLYRGVFGTQKIGRAHV